MPLLDVSDVISDPMFSEDFQITRRAETVGSDGIGATGSEIIQASGVINPGSIGDVTRAVDYEHTKGHITVHTLTRLYDVVVGYKPDLISWQGNVYVVNKVYNWSKYGTGFYAADCELQDLETAL